MSAAYYNYNFIYLSFYALVDVGFFALYFRSIYLVIIPVVHMGLLLAADPRGGYRCYTAVYMSLSISARLEVETGSNCL